MSFKKKTLLWAAPLVAVALVAAGSVAAFQARTGGGSAGVVAAAALAAQQARPGYVTGVARNEDGSPMAGVEITARYGQSNYVSYSRSARTNAQGRYSIYLADRPGTWTVYARTRINSLPMELTADDNAPFAGNEGAVRNFSVQYLEEIEGYSYGTGHMLVMQAAIGDYTDMMEVEVTLQPLDGSPPFTRRFRNTGEGYVVTGLRHSSYIVSATHNGRPLLISRQINPRQDYEWGDTYLVTAQDGGAGISRMRAEIKQR